MVSLQQGWAEEQVPAVLLLLLQAARELRDTYCGHSNHTVPCNEGRSTYKTSCWRYCRHAVNVDSILWSTTNASGKCMATRRYRDAFAKADNILTTAAKGIARNYHRSGLHQRWLCWCWNRDEKQRWFFDGYRRCFRTKSGCYCGGRSLEFTHCLTTTICGNRKILLNITSNWSTMDEIGDINWFCSGKAGNSADLIWGNGVDETLEDKISVTIIATGFSTSSFLKWFINQNQEPKPTTLCRTMILT